MLVMVVEGWKWSPVESRLKRCSRFQENKTVMQVSFEKLGFDALENEVSALGSLRISGSKGR